MNRKVLILGGGGFIGSAIARILNARGNYDITIADIFTRDQDDDEFMAFIESTNIKLIKGDFTDASLFDDLDKDYEDFYMLASMIGVNNTLEIPHEIIRVNTALIYNSLEWLKTTSVKNVVFTSTSENYSGTIERFGYDIPTPEDIPLCIDKIDHPRFTYAVTKMLGESGFMNYAKIFGFKCKIIRYSNIIGPKMGFKHVIPHVVQRFLDNEKPFRIFGGDQTRSFCYIDDGAMGTILAMENESATNDIFHIGAEEEITIEDLIKEIGKHFNYSGEYVNAPTYPGSVSRRCPDITKAKTVLGYKPTLKWQEALIPTVKWYVDYFKSHEKTKNNSFEEPGKFFSDKK
ncbi:NAD-dependent epimerase/dehydratase family protein [Flaviramulus aquimarinus]|uniref:NAD-dependent epimerase/dehydratase family protein n=1 Tax=Flaviramulus aquimarinus TaxID=1170456 RepID=A0ABP9EM74_9FLAO